MKGPGNVIINSPFEAPRRHWQPQRDGTLTLVDERRPASYEIYDVRNNTRRVETLDQVNEIRQRVDRWRADDYPGVTAVTRQLLAHWHDQGARQYPFYFCQLEAIETLIWWVEATDAYRQGVFLQGDGGPWERVCSKMATGSGKTTVMAMLITWLALNAVTYPKRTRDFSRAILIVAPGLTVKERLQVLLPGNPANAYDEFSTCPSDSMRQKLNQAEVLVENWHTLMPAKEQERSVVRKGRETDEVYTRRVLGRLAQHRDIVVINDEAHHAYRKPADVKISKADAERLGVDLDEATRWIEGLDRIHHTRRIGRCFDLSATPFAPTGKTNSEEGLFSWIVSDFGLTDAIEAGLVKTPRVVIRDDALPDAKSYRSKLYHLYRDPDVQQDLNRRGAEPHEALPKLVQDAYTLLGADWRVALQHWQQAGHHSPPVMLTVCNRVETAARIEHSLNHGDAHWPEMKAPEQTLRVDSKVLEKAELGEKAGSVAPEYAERLRAIVTAAGLPADREAQLLALDKEQLLRAIVDNVGKQGQAGQRLQSVISVAMLSEGWDAKNVTHIMGLRAFTSQLLCEQVIGRGLRRVGYDKDENGLFVPEYVNVFGVPLSVFVDAGDGGETPPPPKPSTQIESLPSRNEFEVRWPNLLRVDTVVRPALSVQWSKVPDLQLDPAQTVITAELAPAVGGATDLSKTTDIDLSKLPEEFREQRIVFQAARKAFDQLAGKFTGNREYLVFQLIRLVEQFLASKKLMIPSLFHAEGVRRRILVALNMDLIVQHVVKHVEQQNVASIEPVFDPEQPLGSTRAMRTWFTTKGNQQTRKSQISHVVGDSSWEIYAATLFDASDKVQAYAKNDHLGFQVYYLWGGSRKRFIPDFIVRLANGHNLVLEIKGEDSPMNSAKREALALWVKAVNAKGGFGRWCSDVAFKPAELQDILSRHGHGNQPNDDAAKVPSTT
ncbi:MAG: BPTD_3080 family restriction endonuclease [Betaproteobacteria bacterium]|jgi:type III restriction enzyme|nr:DEAD/DEAH box helicase family protein [Rubrivivax sp.]